MPPLSTQKGFAVFPLKYRDKVPLTRNGCKDATTDAAQIKAWWQKYPNANIGLATGSVSQNVFVIDLDIDEDRGIDGYHSLEDWQREHGISQKHGQLSRGAADTICTIAEMAK